MKRIDHHNLMYFLSNRAYTPFQQKWVTKLLELLDFDYEIQHKNGNDNLAVDALSIIVGAEPLTEEAITPIRKD